MFHMAFLGWIQMENVARCLGQHVKALKKKDLLEAQQAVLNVLAFLKIAVTFLGMLRLPVWCSVEIIDRNV